jgi:TPR repeat protein
MQDMVRLVQVFSLALAMSGAAAAQESVFDLVTECDLLAAHPADAERRAEGVADDAIVPQLAIIACERAIAEDQDAPRLHFQLGRALLATGERLGARNAFVTAAQSDYPPALAYLGDYYQFGWTLEQDLDQARQLYERAAANGFEAARAQVTQLDFDPAIFASPLIGAVYDGAEAGLEALDARQRSYLFGFHATLARVCALSLSGEAALAPYRFRYPPDWSVEDEDDIFVTVWATLAEQDAEAWTRRHGCEGPITQRMARRLGTFFSARVAASR